MPFVFNVFLKTVASIAGKNSFNALLGENASALPVFVNETFLSLGKQAGPWAVLPECTCPSPKSRVPPPLPAVKFSVCSEVTEQAC